MTGETPKPAGTGLEGVAAATRRLRLLIATAMTVAFVVVVVGGVVRVSDAGLGCGPANSGTYGWPMCEGRLIPNVDTHTLIEYTHRAVASILVLLLLLIVWTVVRKFSANRSMKILAFTALGLVGVQAVLGGLTVEYGLKPGFVAAHLVLALLLLLNLLALYRLALAPATGPSTVRALGPVAVAACLLLLATIAAGGVIAGTEGRGLEEGSRIVGAHYACGQEFPTCGGSLLPFNREWLVDVQLTHRVLMFFATIAVLAFALLLHRRRFAGRLPAAMAVAVLAQVLLGAVNVWADESAVLVLAHLTLATVLWMLVAEALVRIVDSGRQARVPQEPADATVPPVGATGAA
jgi:heme A synthase